VGSNLIEEGGLIEDSRLVRRNDNFFRIPSVVIKPLGQVREFEDLQVAGN